MMYAGPHTSALRSSKYRSSLYFLPLQCMYLCIQTMTLWT